METLVVCHQGVPGRTLATLSRLFFVNLSCNMMTTLYRGKLAHLTQQDMLHGAGDDCLMMVPANEELMQEVMEVDYQAFGNKHISK